MSTSDQIYLGTAGNPADVAKRIAAALDVESGIRQDGYAYVARALADPPDFVSGVVDRNYEEPDLLPDEISVTDGYPIEIDLYLTGSNSEERLHRETRRLFEDLSGVLDVPALYISRHRLVLAYQPQSGVVGLPADTSPDADGQPVWAPFVLDRHALES